MITEDCNCRCFFCSRNNLSIRSQEPNLDDCIKVFDMLYNAYPSSKLVLSGGEPTLASNFLSILKYVSSRFEKVEIQTNGTYGKYIADEIKPYLSENVFLQFSLDGYCQEHDSIRGKGVFDSVVENIKYLEEYSSHLSVSTTVTPSNIESVLLLSEFLNNLKFRRLSVSYVQPLSPRKEIIISNKSWNSFVDKLLVRCYYRVDIIKFYDFDLMNRFRDSELKWQGIVNCGRGVTHFYVTPNFDVLPCTCTEYRVGNLLRDDITSIKSKLALEERVTVDNKSVCHDCEYLAMCNGGCPGLSLKVFGTENMGDIRCPKVCEYAISQNLVKIENII